MKKRWIIIFSSILVFILVFAIKENTHYENDLEKVNSSQAQIIPWGQKLVGTDSLKKKQIKVAVIDSGINSSHEDLKGKVIKKYNVLEPKKEVIDDFGHGTAVAGIITANDNNIGFLGVNQNIELLDIKVLNSHGQGKLEDLINGVKWAIENNVDIINISFGVQSDSRELQNVILEAYKANIIIIAAVGNTYGLNIDYPANYSEVLSVSAINKDLETLSSSAKGKIDFTAPGDQILSTNKNGNYELFSGSSFAAAYVTGIIAFWINEYENNFNNKVKEKGLNDFFNYLEQNAAENTKFNNIKEHGILLKIKK